MFEFSEKFCEYFYELYKITNKYLKTTQDFNDIFENNASRIEYVISVFDEIEKNNSYFSKLNYLEELLKYIVEYMKGNKKGRNIKVSDEYFKDESVGAIIPTMEEFNFLLKMIENNKSIFDRFYKNKSLFLELPNNSFNQNMERVLKIEDYNLTHLLGLTEYEDPHNTIESKNLLKKYIKSHVENKDSYGTKDAEIVLNWITSTEGKKQLRLIHEKTLEFVELDKKNNPNSYDEKGNLKTNSSTIMKFKERYKQHTGLDYPIINFSRIMVKSINTYNFFRLNNVSEMILDYNAPKGKTNEKDIFLVSGKSKEISMMKNKYVDMRTDIIIDLYRYAYNQDDLSLKKKLIDNGIDVNKSEIKDQINIIQSDDFLRKFGIEPDDRIIDEKIIKNLNLSFDRNIHMLGFNTEFNGEVEIPLGKFVTHGAHCDTSIVVTVPELIGDYYIRGRPFFIDKIKIENRIVMVSNVRDEMNYLNSVIDVRQSAYQQLNDLKGLVNALNKKYKNYLSKFRKEKNR